MYELRGGKLLGAGTYGCVFDPPLICKGETSVPVRDRKKLGKITAPVDAATEIKAALALRDLQSPYFLLPDAKSVCEPGEKQKEKDLKLCKAVEANPLSGFVQFKMPYGGQQLLTLITNTSFLGPNFSFFDVMLQFLEAGSYLIAKQYVHYDISPGNVVVNKEGQISLIDFGMSFSGKEINEDTLTPRWKVYLPSYMPEPPEITIISGLFQKIAPNQSIPEIIRNKWGCILASQVLGISEKKQRYELELFWKSSRAAQAQDWVTFWQLYWPTFDSWAIGSILSLILRSLLLRPEFTNDRRWKERGPMIKYILRGLLQVNPRKRLDCVEALKLYDPDNVWFETFGTSWLSSRAKQHGGADSSL